jgi:hypothetical protein
VGTPDPIMAPADAKRNLEANPIFSYTVHHVEEAVKIGMHTTKIKVALAIARHDGTEMKDGNVTSILIGVVAIVLLHRLWLWLQTFSFQGLLFSCVTRVRKSRLYYFIQLMV